jgi:hypothetical protein
LTPGSGAGDGSETPDEDGAAAGGDFVPDEFGSGLTNSDEVDAIALRSFGWVEAAAFTAVGGGAASAFSFGSFGWEEATAFTRFGAGGPTIPEDGGDTVRDDAFGQVAFVGLGLPVGAFKPSFGTEPA